ncbi:MAG: hypothetical protein ACR2H1_13840, partial [Limisphaerales bacterium]
MNLKNFLCMILFSATVVGTSAEIVNPASAAKQLAHVKELLIEVPLIDGHNDLPWEYRKHGNDMNVFDLT